MIRAFAFDLDETLVDCEPQHERATTAMLEALGHPPRRVADLFHGDATGARTFDIIDAYRAQLGLPQSVDELLSLRHSAFLAALDEEPAAPLPGARELLDACRARGDPIALVTSGHRDDALATLESARLRHYFQAIVTGEDVLEPKPAAEPYLVAASRLGIPPADILVFEDSARGVTAALAAGCAVVAVPNARSTAPERVEEASVVLTSLAEALPMADLLVRLQ
jgi:HAD superfamily hydrolase (TIGR01509 family)